MTKIEHPFLKLKEFNYSSRKSTKDCFTHNIGIKKNKARKEKVKKTREKVSSSIIEI